MAEAGKHQATAASRLLLAFALIIIVSLAQAGRLLVVPVDGSHWTGVKAVAEELGQRGHSVVVVIPEVSLRLGPSKHCTTKVFPVPYTKGTIDNMHSKHVEMLQGNHTFLQRMSVFLTTISNVTQLMTTTVESLFYNEELISYLRDQNFDAMLTDPVMPIGVMLAEFLGLPSVYMLRGFPCNLDSAATACPSPPAFVPRFFTHNTDRMSFSQRLGNTLVSMLEPLLCKAFFWSFDSLASRILQRDVTLVDMMKGASLWLMRYDFTFEFPRPLMPNMVLVGGINCAVRSALPKHLRNLISTLMEIQLCRVIYASFDELATKYLGQVTTYRELIGGGAVWLLRYDFTFEYPRPIMPNMVFIGGINCVERNSLPAVSPS